MELEDTPRNYPTTATFATTMAVALFVYYYYKQTKGLPPGPIGLPLLGFWPFLQKDTVHVQLSNLRKKYGAVFSFNVTGHLFVNLGNFKAIREAKVSKHECFDHRMPYFSLLTTIFKGGLPFTKDEQWKTLRRHFTSDFRDRGMMSIRNNVSGPIYDMVEATVQELVSSGGGPVNIVEMLNERVNEIWFQTLFGEEGVTAQEKRRINELYTVVSKYITSYNVLLTGEIARYVVIPFLPDFRKAAACSKKVADILMGVIQRHKKTFDEHRIRDIIDSYIKEKKDRERKNDDTSKHFTDEALRGTLVQILGDGAISVAPFISAFVLALLDHPDHQLHMHRELQEVVGSARQPTVEDRARLPVTNAFLLEVLRTTDFFPLSPSLICTRETTIGGYRVPKGAVILQNGWSAHTDPSCFDEPEAFKPERYMPVDGERRAELPVMFGVGKRYCLGESFVMMQVFLFVAAIVKNFRLVVHTKGTSNSNYHMLAEGNLQICAIPWEN